MPATSDARLSFTCHCDEAKQSRALCALARDCFLSPPLLAVLAMMAAQLKRFVASP